MMFLDCPAYLDQEGTLRCGLPAEVRCRFTMRSTGGPLESAMIRCPAGHWFNGPVESLACEREDRHAPASAGITSRAGQDSGQRAHDRPDSGGLASREFPAGPQREVSRPSTAPPYYLGRPASLWITAMRPRLSRTASSDPQPAADSAGRVPLTLP